MTLTMSRKAKLRCDHEWPSCGRCASRSLICVYHPAPLTRTQGPAAAEVYFAIPTPNDSPVTDSVQETRIQPSQNLGNGFEYQPSRGSPNGSMSQVLENGSRSENFAAIFSEHGSSFVKNIMDVVSHSFD